MFAFLGYTSDNKEPNAAATLQGMATHLGLTAITIQKVRLGPFRLAFFDTAGELDCFQNDTHCLLLIGRPIANAFNQPKSEHGSRYTPAEIVLRAYQDNPNCLADFDGHIAFVLYDSRTGSITLAADRFQRYSIVFRIGDDVLVSSHSTILYPYVDRLRLDRSALSFSVHFRWLTGNQRLFESIRQVLPGCPTHIDRHGQTQQAFYFISRFQRRQAATVDDFTRKVDTALDACLSKIADVHEKIGIPLSGGVDSSLLLAKAKEHFKECVAVSARFASGPNPELENAITTAKSLKVRHVVTEVDDQFVQEFFPILVRLHEQPPRNFSDIALAKVLQTLSLEVDAFLYGEAADTFFGTNQVQSLIMAAKRSAPFLHLPRQFQKLVASIFPRRPRRHALVRRLLTNGLDELVLTHNNIEYFTNPSRVFPCPPTPPASVFVSEQPDFYSLSLADQVSIQALATGVANHVENTGRLASYFGLHMYVPFLLDDVRSTGEQLPLALHTRDGVYKPVLRDLLSQYLDKSIVYSRKFGFPTPTLQWLESPLKERVSTCREGKGAGQAYYSDTALRSLTAESDFAILWYAICLDEICGHAGAMMNDERMHGSDAQLYQARQ